MKTDKRIIHLLGYASALGGVHPGCGEGPLKFKQSNALKQLSQEFSQNGIHLNWDAMFKPEVLAPELLAQGLEKLCQELGNATSELTHQKAFFMVMGGDHTSAIGTWSGVREAIDGSLGLLWVDAHMDSHTTDTSQTGRFHGMPLAALLGYGDKRFTQLLTSRVKINPAQVCLVGVRSYEPEEAELLKRLGVRVFFMDEVKKRGLEPILKEALEIVTAGTAGFGISLDIDSLDPQDAPGVDVPEPDGLFLKELCAALKPLAIDPRLLGVELVEYNPDKDIDHLTEKAIIELMKALVVK